MKPQYSSRVITIDLLRALTMTLMIFVNDLWTLTDIPQWLEHTAAMEDGMGMADTVFPAFLFITGMSVPLAVMHRQSLGETNTKIAVHILLRSLALLSMGLYLVSGEYLHETATGLPRLLWNVMVCTCFILIWNRWPARISKLLVKILQLIAIAVLLILAWVCRTNDAGNIGRFSSFWWGILGLIGWAYLVTALFYLFCKGRLSAMFAGWLVWMGLCIASHASLLQGSTWLNVLLSPIGNGAMPALVTGGAITTLLFLKYRADTKKLFLMLRSMAIVLLLMGFIARRYWIISKILATPTWVFICSAITIFAFLLLYLLAEVKSKSYYFNGIKPAGTQTLLSYLMPYFAYAIFMPTGLHLPYWMLSGFPGLLKSLCFSLLMVTATGFLSKRGIRLKI